MPRPYVCIPLEKRFWAKVEKTDGCWIWIAGKRSSGYGEIKVNGVGTVSAHRVSWILAHGSIPEGACVLHRCDVRACVRPDHLYLGDRGDNARDTHRRGRWKYVPPGHGRKRGPPKKRGAKPKPVAERFWPKVDQRGGDVDQCWPWIAGRWPTGYGQFFMPGRGPVNNRVYAHRIAYELHYGPIPKGLFVLHRCDNRPCCNPTHLWLGTIGDNNRDRGAKGRTADQRGQANGNAKLTDEQVAEIRARYTAARGQQSALAREFGVGQPQIWRIVNGLQR